MSGPSPMYQPTFPADFLQRCRQLARRRTTPHALGQRARLALLLHESPALPNPAAAAAVDLPPTPSGPCASAGWQGISPRKIRRAVAAKPLFPPTDPAVVKALAHEAVCQTKLPLSRLSSANLAARAKDALGKPISPSTVWRIPGADAVA